MLVESALSAVDFCNSLGLRGTEEDLYSLEDYSSDVGKSQTRELSFIIY